MSQHGLSRRLGLQREVGLSQGNGDRLSDYRNLVRQTIQVLIWAYYVGRGGKHEKATQNQPLEGSLEEKESQEMFEKVQGRKKVFLLAERRKTYATIA
jgi:hypothetical protein